MYNLYIYVERDKLVLRFIVFIIFDLVMVYFCIEFFGFCVWVSVFVGIEC